MRRAVALVLLAALAALPPPVADAQTEVVLRWDYVLRPDPARGVVNVELRLDGMAGAVTAFTFITATHREPVGNVTPGPATTIRDAPGRGGFEVAVDGPERFRYDVDVNRDAFRPGEKLSHLASDFGLFKAESLSLAYTYTYYEGHVFRNVTTVRIEPPPGWRAAAPWPEEDGVHHLPADHVAPRGFVAMGPIARWTNETLAGVRVQHVRLGAAPAFEEAVLPFLANALPYAQAVYGRGASRELLVVTAGDPMLRGGLAGVDSLYVHEDGDLRTLAHEHAHVHQRFGADETAGTSTVWLTEGDADLHGALSLLAAGEWSPARVQEVLDEAERARHDPALEGARLVDATYGASLDGRSLERFAYSKGLVVLRALDAELRSATAGSASLSTLLRALNARHEDPTRPGASLPVTNAEVEAEASHIAGADLSAFFRRYVHASEWPDPPPFVPEGELEVSSLRLDPARAPPGERVEVSVEVANRGTRPLARALDLLVDGEVVQTLPVSLAVGQTTTLRASIAAGAPGDHEVRVLYERATLRSLTPPELSLGRVTLLPATLRAGEEATILVFVENAGEMPGLARVEVRTAREARTMNVTVEGLSGAVAEAPLTFDAPGTARVDVALAGTPHARSLDVDVQPPEPRRPAGLPALLVLVALGAAALAGRARS